jgi:predicted dehydrogenase
VKKNFDRRQFIKATSVAGLGWTMASPFISGNRNTTSAGGRVGIIGLDTSHSVAFTETLNGPNPASVFEGYKVVAAYPRGSQDIVSATERIPGYIDEVKKYGVEICPSLEDLLSKCDVVVLETNDGRVHLEQALQVFKAGKPVFIDKPVAASLKDAIAIYDAAAKYKVPVFSSSSLRFMENVQAVVNGKIGRVLGADTYSPAKIEKTHPDFFWYGIHGIEALFTVMGPGCRSVVRVHADDTDIVVGTWNDGRLGTFRGTRSGKADFGGIAFGENGNSQLGPFLGYELLLARIITFFRTGKAPVRPEETLEILAFMEAADESRKKGGAPMNIDAIMHNARKK